MIKNENELVQYYIVNKDLINNYNSKALKILFCNIILT